MMLPLTVAIDGYSSCGKSTIAKALAKHACSTYVDTGAMYRAIALFMMRQNITQPESIIQMLAQVHIDFTTTADGAQHVILNGEDVESSIRTLEVGNRASEISQIKEVRAFLVAQQQQMGERGVVMDGRDIGTVVFPNAELKLFMTASAQVRAERRYKELQAKGGKESFEEVLKNIEERDYIDAHRETAPLVRAEDAILLDNSYMTVDEQCAWLSEILKDKFDINF